MKKNYLLSVALIIASSGSFSCSEGENKMVLSDGDTYVFSSKNSPYEICISKKDGYKNEVSIFASRKDPFKALNITIRDGEFYCESFLFSEEEDIFLYDGNMDGVWDCRMILDHKTNETRFERVKNVEFEEISFEEYEKLQGKQIFLEKEQEDVNTKEISAKDLQSSKWILRK